MATENKTSAAIAIMEQHIRDVHQLSMVDVENIPAVILKYKRMEEALHEIVYAKTQGRTIDIDRTAIEALSFDPL